MMRLATHRPITLFSLPNITQAKTWTSGSRRCKVELGSTTTQLVSLNKISSLSRNISQGHATPEATESYFRRLRNEGISTSAEMKGWCSGTGFTTSRVGFGGYRIDFDDPEYRDALSFALGNGCNIIDTSSNYQMGESEGLVGECIAVESALKKIKREEIVVVTKGGYIQGPIAHEVNKRLTEGRPYFNVVEINAHTRHCISPDFIRDQIDQSLKRLRMETIDAYLLHNPEYYFKPHEGKVQSGSLQHQKIQEDFYDLIKRTFEVLEDEVKKGHIQYYGISSNTFVTPKTHFAHVSLERTLEIAQWVSDRHHYKVIEFPMNIVEPQALIKVNNVGETLLSYASARGFMTLSNRPLNSEHPRAKGLVRLVDTSPSHKDKDLMSLLSEAFNFTIALEKAYQGLQKPDDPFLPNYKEVSWGQILGSNSEQFSDPSIWDYVLKNQIQPSLQKNLRQLTNNQETKSWAVKYRAAMTTLLQRFGWMVQANHSSQIRQLNKFINAKFPVFAHPQYQFSDKAVDLLLNTNVDVVLMGLRRMEYVKEFFPKHPFPHLEKSAVKEALQELHTFLTAPPKSKEQKKTETQKVEKAENSTTPV